MKRSATVNTAPLLGVAFLIGCSTPEDDASNAFATFTAGEMYYGELITQDSIGPLYFTWEPEANCFNTININGQEVRLPSDEVQEIRFAELTEEQRKHLQLLKSKTE